MNNADILMLSHKDEDLCEVIIVNGNAALHDLSEVPCNNGVLQCSDITLESSRKHSDITSETSRMHSCITSESSRKHSCITSETSRKHSGITLESFGEDGHITSESSGKRHRRHHHHRRYHNTSVSSGPLVDCLSSCQESTVTGSGGLASVQQSAPSNQSRNSSEANSANQSSKVPSSSSAETSAASRHRHHRYHKTSVSSRPLADCLSSCRDSIVTRSGDLTCVQQSPPSSHSRKSSKANSANQSSVLSSLSSAEMFAANGTTMECAAQGYVPLVIDATNVSKSKVKYTSSACSLVDAIIGEKSEYVEMVQKLDDCILMVPGRKRRRANRGGPETVKAGVIDTLTACMQKQKYSQRKDTLAAFEHKQKYSRHEDDICSVISLESDDEVQVIDSDPKPQLDCSTVSDVVIDTPHDRKPETVIIDLCTPSKNSESPVLPQTRVDHEDEKVRSRSEYKYSEPAVKEYVSVLDNGFHASRSKPHDVPSVIRNTACQRIVPLASSASATSASNPAVNSGVEKMWDCEVVFISSGKEGDKMNVPSVCDSRLQCQNHSDVRTRLKAIDNRMEQASAPSTSMYGNNLYNPHPSTVRMGLRPIVIDGSNVAMGHSNGRIFSCRGLQICIDYFLKRRHRVVAFVPQFRKSSFHSQDTEILDYLEKQGLVSFTPSRRIRNQLVVPYDDRYIVQYAAECGGVIVSTDTYRDLVEENPAWRETIEKRLLMFTWVGDVLMFPQDPLGRRGPNLESFLRFPSGDPAETQ